MALLKVPFYQVDAFADRPFAGNPAAICPLQHWLPDDLLQAVAAENNLSETAFFVPEDNGYALRWFTPTVEVDLCGHATLASAHVLFEHLDVSADTVAFVTRSGRLTVDREADACRMDFPAKPAVTCEPPAALLEGLGRTPDAVLAADDYIVVFRSEEEIRTLAPEFGPLASLDRRGVAVTAPGQSVDFVSRFFAPGAGIAEDPVTGSAHCELAPYWASRLGHSRLQAKQLSKRGGEVDCEVAGDRVLLRGRAVTVIQGELILPAP